MKTLLFCGVLCLIHMKLVVGRAHVESSSRCINMWDEGCTNGQLPGSGRDDDYVNGGFNPGKRCVNMWDEGCINEQLPGAGRDDDYVNGNFSPGKRCIGEGCSRSNSDGDLNNEVNKRLTYYILAKLLKNAHN